MSDKPELRDQLRKALRTAGLSQTKAARQLGISNQHLSHVLCGGTQPSLALAERIALLCAHELTVVPIGLAEDVQSLLAAQSRMLNTWAQVELPSAGLNDHQQQLWRDLHQAADRIRDVLDQPGKPK